MKKAYISGPITGIPDYYRNFMKAEIILKKKGFNVLNPAKLGRAFPELEYSQYMHIDLLLVHYSDAIFMLKDWKKSKGAVMEHSFAESAKKLIFYVEDL